MMVALFFILLGAIILLIAACRIWMDAPAVDSPGIDSVPAQKQSELDARDRLTIGKAPVG